MTALRAARTKPNGGVVGYYDVNFEFHEAACPPPYPLSIKRWVSQRRGWECWRCGKTRRSKKRYATRWNGSRPTANCEKKNYVT